VGLCFQLHVFVEVIPGLAGYVHLENGLTNKLPELWSCVLQKLSNFQKENCVSLLVLTADADTLMQLFATRQLMAGPLEHNLAIEGWMVEIEMLNVLLFVQRAGVSNHHLVPVYH
jgi:hypothetical protein